jgi:hypothetical protein
VRKTLVGSIFINQQVERPDNDKITSSGISLATFKERYMNGSNQSSNGALFYDAVWSIVLALNSVSANWGSYKIGQPNVTDLIAKRLVDTPFEGLSGRIHFNNETGHVDQNAQFFVINADNITMFAYFNEENNNITLYDPSLKTETVFIRYDFNEVIVTIPKPLAYFILLLLLLAFILTLVLNIITCVFRNTSSVKASSIKLSQVTFIGCYVLALGLLYAVIIYGFADVVSRDAVCILQHILDVSLSVGLTLLLGAVSVRLWRLHRIFNFYNDPGKLLLDQHLILVIVILVIINLVLTVPTCFVKKYVYRPKTTEIERESDTITKILTCERGSSVDYFLWFTSSLVVSTILLSTIIVLAILTRNIPQRNFNKTTSVMYLSYLLAAIIPFTIGVYFILTSLDGYLNMVLRCCTLCLLFMCLIIIPCALLFIPPLLPLLKTSKKIQLLL